MVQGTADEPEVRKRLREARLAEMHTRMKAQLADKLARDEAEASQKEARIDLRDQLKPRLDAWSKGKQVAPSCVLLCFMMLGFKHTCHCTSNAAAFVSLLAGALIYSHCCVTERVQDNIRSLLSTMHTVLWDGSGWVVPGMTDLIEPARVRKQYMKANLVVHPDKVNQKGGTTEQLVIADIVFDVLKGAWARFEATELRPGGAAPGGGPINFGH